MQIITEFDFVKENKTNSTFAEASNGDDGVVGIPSRPGQFNPRDWVLAAMAGELGHLPTRIRMILEPIE